MDDVILNKYAIILKAVIEKHVQDIERFAVAVMKTLG